MPRISLRQLLALVTLIAVAVVSLRYASATWEAIVLCLTVTVFFATAIVAIVGRGQGQAFAIGLAVVMAGYGFFKFREAPPTTADFGIPTTFLLVQFVWATDIAPMKYVLPIGHCWWALLFGYLGGHFARFIYARRTRENAAANSTSADGR